MRLDAYVAKRDFRRTPEPRGDARPRRGKPPIFVVQRHHARREHYDFRLEVDGRLRSWAVPKQPSLQPGDKRLAVQVEDHPLAYADFAGEIPKGQYGAGQVEIYDRGHWRTAQDPASALAAGKLDFELFGDKLHGRWTLVRTRAQARQPQWLLIKRSDAEDASSPTPTSTAPRPPASNWRDAALALPRARSGALPIDFAAQQAALHAEPPAGPDWLHELKWDGYRLLASIDAGQVLLRTRNGLDWTARLPAIAQALHALPVQDARLDGELVVLNEAGLSDFSALQARLATDDGAALRYVLFDLLQLDGVVLVDSPLWARKQLLQALLDGANAGLHYSSHIDGQGAEVYQASIARGAEGIVSKRREAPYRPGRNADWRKIKHAQSDDFLVVGFTRPRGRREGLGALLLAEAAAGALRYVGRVGTGFDTDSLTDLARDLHPRRTRQPPVTLPRDAKLTLRDVTWIRPEQTVEVAFRGRTADGLLRQASFLRLREDKPMPAPVKLSSPDKLLYPDDGISKQQVFEYYRGVADRLLPEVIMRPLSLLRCPDGIDQAQFFQKHHRGELGRAVHAVQIMEKSGQRKPYVYIEDLDGLLELVQHNVLEFHPWGARIDDPEHPDRITFDLDPDPALPWREVRAAARELRNLLAEVGLQSFVRLSGGKGAHLVVPIERGPDWTEVKAFCEAFAKTLARQQPQRYIAKASRAERHGRIFIDWLRNGRGATSVCSWSLRARPGAPVAIPLRWDEFGRSRSARDFDLAKAQRRLRRLGSGPWPALDSIDQTLPTAESLRHGH